MPAVSVVIPVYNSAKYLRECLDSVVAQTFSDWEVVAVDDGSSDNSPVILDEYAAKDSRIKVIHKANGGVSAARNDGLAAASGEYVLFADSDDLLLANALDVLYKKISDEKADIVFGDHLSFQGNDGPEKDRRYIFFNKPFATSDRETIVRIQQTVLYRGFSPYYSERSGYLLATPWAKLFRRQLLVDCGISFPLSISLFEDGIFVLRALQCSSRVCYVQEPICRYRVLSTSLCHAHEMSPIDVYRAISKEVLLFIESNGADQLTNAYQSRFLYYAKKQAGQLFSGSLSFWAKYRNLKILLNDPFYKPFVAKVPSMRLVGTEKVFGILAYRRLYLLLAVILWRRRG
jgi:glycosyltransferase involved in cell wall biosynthesis